MGSGSTAPVSVYSAIEMDYPKVYVIVVTYNGMQWLDRCFGSLAASDLPVKCIAVDNGSTDGTPNCLRDRYSEVEVIETGENLGFGKANNIGISRALESGCDYVYLLNQDAWIDPDTIGKMVQTQQKHPDYYVLSPIQLSGDRSKPDGYFDVCTREPNCKGYGLDKETGKMADVYEVGFIMAAHWLVSRESLLTIGGFAPVFPHYGEDDNYLQRVVYHGFKVGICPHTCGVHDRENRESTPEGIINRLYIVYLVIACNINRRGWLAWLSAMWRINTTGIRYVFRFKSLRPVLMIAKSLCSLNKVIDTRKRTRMSGPNYLSGSIRANNESKRLK